MIDSVQRHSALTGWVLAIINTMRAEGIDVDSVLNNIGLDPDLLEGGYSRYSQELVSELWKKAIELSGDPHFGFKVASSVRPANFHVLGYAMNCSNTLMRALQRFAHFCRLISDSATATLTENNETCVLTFYFDTGGDPPVYQTVDTVLASVVAFLRWISHKPLVPEVVNIVHRNRDKSDAYQEFFGCPVKFRELQNSIVFKKRDLETVVMSSDEELATLLDSVAIRYLDQRMAGTFAVRIRDLILAHLPNETPTKATIAKELGFTERTLLRRLKNEGTTYADVLRNLREELAFEYLKRGMRLEEVAYELGFSDPGTFSRAFKSWTGRRPSTVKIEELK